ncbi:MAG: hypothetical protein AAGM67_19710, partial [Bacteroidota bacterium]
MKTTAGDFVLEKPIDCQHQHNEEGSCRNLPPRVREILRDLYFKNPSMTPAHLIHSIEGLVGSSLSHSQCKLLKSYRKNVLKKELKKLKKVALSSNTCDLLEWCRDQYLFTKLQCEESDEYTSGVLGYFLDDSTSEENCPSFYCVFGSAYSLANIVRSESVNRLTFYSDATYDPCYEDKFKVCQ